MAFKIKVNGFGKAPSLTSTTNENTKQIEENNEQEKEEVKLQPVKKLHSIKMTKKEEELYVEPEEEKEEKEEEEEGFVLGDDFEKTEHVEKKAFEGHNKEVLFSKGDTSNIIPDDINALPDFNISIVPDSELNTEQAKQKIIEREEQKVQHSIDTEIRKEKEAMSISLAPTVNHAPPQQEVIKVVCIGGNEQYYKTILSKLNTQYPDIDFIKHISVGGKNAFYTIDTMNPDIILIYHKSNLQTALQFYDSIQNDMDESGLYYRDKYKHKRVVVIAPQDDFSYDMQLRNKGIDFYVKEINARTRTVDIKELINVIRQAYADIKSQKQHEQKLAQEALERQQKVEQEALMDSLPNIEIQTEDTPQNQQVVVPPVQEETIVQQQPVTPKQTANTPAFNPFENPNLAMNQIGMGGEHKVIGVYSASGGAGKTMFATNIASILSKYSNNDGNGNNYKVCLVEYNLVCQNIDLFFNIKSDKNIGVLAQEVAASYLNQETGRVEIEPAELRPLLSQYIYKEPNTGLDILLGITVPLEIDRLKKGFSQCLFKTLKEMYDVVIVDMSADIAKTPILETFNETNYIYYIMPMEVTAIRNTNVLFKFLTGLFKFPPENIKVIINKADNDNEEFDIKQVYEALANSNCIPEGTIPYMDKDVLSSINRGIPLAIEQMNNPVVQAIYSIAAGINPMLTSEELLEEDTAKEEKTGFLGKFFGGNKDKKKVASATKKSSNKKSSIFSKKKNAETPVVEEPEEKPKKKSFFGSKKTEESEEKPKKKSFFGSKKNEDVQEKPKKKSLFGSKKAKEIPQELDDLPELPPLDGEVEDLDREIEDLDKKTEEKPQKKSFFARFFGDGGKKKKTSAPKIKNKKKSFGGLLGKGRGNTEEVAEEIAGTTPTKRPSRLLSARPRKREQ